MWVAKLDVEETSRPVRPGPPGPTIFWARWGPLSRLIASALKPRHPPVLILSLARSGSSWVGDMLGSAPDALYLREPLTQGHHAITSRVVFDPDTDHDLEPLARRLADKAFLGWPDFGPQVVRLPGNWALRGRRGRRVVVKEVNPSACAWYLRRYRPRVIFLLRHPAAVAMSSQKQGWLGPTVDAWARRGLEDASALRQARDVLKDYPDAQTVFFESLCNDPLRGFRTLFDFAGLTWTDWAAETVREYSHDSPRRIDAWRADTTPDALKALREGYRTLQLEWYQGDKEW